MNFRTPFLLGMLTGMTATVAITAGPLWLAVLSMLMTLACYIIAWWEYKRIKINAIVRKERR